MKINNNKDNEFQNDVNKNTPNFKNEDNTDQFKFNQDNFLQHYNNLCKELNGNIGYAISKQWWEIFQSYLYMQSENIQIEIENLDNQSILNKNGWQEEKDIQEKTQLFLAMQGKFGNKLQFINNLDANKNYQIVNYQVWQTLKEKFNGGPEIVIFKNQEENFDEVVKKQQQIDRQQNNVNIIVNLEEIIDQNQSLFKDHILVFNLQKNLQISSFLQYFQGQVSQLSIYNPLTNGFDDLLNEQQLNNSFQEFLGQDDQYLFFQMKLLYNQIKEQKYQSEDNIVNGCMHNSEAQCNLNIKNLDSYKLYKLKQYFREFLIRIGLKSGKFIGLGLQIQDT
ncbi:hypothetical protein PPERSA_03723 [Pseudocohnilembus persalinus]|uniref:DUSP domain-containing protein n=1 Tax=Pseudocohnilembus persalinus TaxID=266149 RepID=A0A0V0QHE1_PSEPJ|nr:hypothetical protein PPERSA_03723 [Pseudocohnilembus persalinus]|eukprot:KRX01639.1 hypothetical protein PPERSA_03723 [Pseudocohnilembus persalinus]